jgi:hypothetical protein
MKYKYLNQKWCSSLACLHFLHPIIQYDVLCFRTMALSFVPHVRVTWHTRFYLAVRRVARAPHPAPRRLLSNLLRACALRTPHLLGCVLNPCFNYHFRISLTLKLSLSTHTTAKYQGSLMVAALLILRIRIFRWSEGAFNLCLLSDSCVPRKWLRW